MYYYAYGDNRGVCFLVHSIEEDDCMRCVWSDNTYSLEFHFKFPVVRASKYLHLLYLGTIT